MFVQTQLQSNHHKRPILSPNQSGASTNVFIHHQPNLGKLHNDSYIPGGCHKQHSHKAWYCSMTLQLQHDIAAILKLKMDCIETNRFIYTAIWHDIAGRHNDTPPEMGPAPILSHQLGLIAKETLCIKVGISCFNIYKWKYIPFFHRQMHMDRFWPLKSCSLNNQIFIVACFTLRAPRHWKYYAKYEWVSEWLNLTAFLGTTDSQVHIVHISHVIIVYKLESLSSLT